MLESLFCFKMMVTSDGESSIFEGGGEADNYLKVGSSPLESLISVWEPLLYSVPQAPPFPLVSTLGGLCGAWTAAVGTRGGTVVGTGQWRKGTPPLRPQAQWTMEGAHTPLRCADAPHPPI